MSAGNNTAVSANVDSSTTTTSTGITTYHNPFYGEKPILRGQFHKWGAIIYPVVFGVPLQFHAASTAATIVRNANNYKDTVLRRQQLITLLTSKTLLFNFAVESIMVASGTLHTYWWKTDSSFQKCRKIDFIAIFVGIASFYSSVGKLVVFLGTTGTKMNTTVVDAAGNNSELLVFNHIEQLVWTAAIIGSTLKWFIPDAPRYVNASMFLVQGWAVSPLFPTLFRMGDHRHEVMGVALGGIFVTLGAIAYSLQWPTVFANDINPSLTITGTNISKQNYKGEAESTQGKNNGNKTESEDRVIFFGHHELFHMMTLLMFSSFWYTMWVGVTSIQQQYQ